MTIIQVLQVSLLMVTSLERMSDTTTRVTLSEGPVWDVSCSLVEIVRRFNEEGTVEFHPTQYQAVVF